MGFRPGDGAFILAGMSDLRTPGVTFGPPFVIRRVVRWGDTDTAQIIYTPRFLDYVVEACETFCDEYLGVDWHRLRMELGMGNPMVHASLDFIRPLRAADRCDIYVYIDDISRATVSFRMVGRNMKGEDCFKGKLVSCFIRLQPDGSIKSTPIPDEWRAKLEDYRASCEKVSQ